MGWRGPITDRQLRVWRDWDDAQWNELTKLDWYLMRVAQRAANAFGATMSVEDQRLVFEEYKPKRKRTQRELDLEWKHSFSRVGGRIRHWVDGKLVYMDGYERTGDS